MVCLCLSLIYISCQYFKNFADMNNWYSIATNYAKWDVISRQNKKFKLKYLTNKTLERKITNFYISIKFPRKFIESMHNLQSVIMFSIKTYIINTYQIFSLCFRFR